MVTKNDVAVDVFPFVQACEQKGRLVMNGVFRHAEALGKHFTPIVYLGKDEIISYEGIKIVSSYLNKQVEIYRETDIRFQQFKVFLSLGVDQFNPLLPKLKGKIHLATILHDTLALQGFFGERNRENYNHGVDWNDTFLYVSETSLVDFNLWAIRKDKILTDRNFVPYGCPHKCVRSEATFVEQNRAKFGLTVHTLDRRKNLAEENKLIVQIFAKEHRHVGEKGDDISCDALPIHRLEKVSDKDLWYLYRQASMFACLSSAEGFSMPPMEAILHGIPLVFLSDIPIHREIYGKLNVNFRTPDLKIGELKQVSRQDRMTLFYRYSFGNLVQPFENFLESL